MTHHRGVHATVARAFVHLPSSIKDENKRIRCLTLRITPHCLVLAPTVGLMGHRAVAFRPVLVVPPTQIPKVLGPKPTSNSVFSAPSVIPILNSRPADHRLSAMQSGASPTTLDTSSNRELAATPFTIVGGGRVGLALRDMGPGFDVLVGRGQPVEGLQAGPIVVCTRNDDLQAVVDATPENRRNDLVFIQNGMLQPWLDARGLGDNTQVLVYFAVAKKGEAPTDGRTDVNPEGLTAAYGPHAATFAARLHSAGLSCKVLDRTDFQKSMLEKLIWICAFMLVGARHGGCSVGQVESEYSNEVRALIQELARAGAAALEATLDAGVEDRLCAYARSVAHFPTAIKEFSWRNGWFYDLSRAAQTRGQPDPCPLHTSWLKEVGAF